MEEALKQNSSGLYLEIQKIGCFFRAACRMAEYEAERQFKPCRLTVSQLNTIWDLANRLHYIENRKIKDSAKIANLALAALDVKGRFVEVATFADGKMKWYASVNDRRAGYYIQKIKTNYTEGTHFRNVNAYGQVAWDPYEPEIKAAGIYYTICYRYDGEKNNG